MRLLRTPRDWQHLLGWLALSGLVAVGGARFTPGDWYAGLAKPAGTPPNWMFAPVWTVLYGAMAVAAWRVSRTQGFRHPAIRLYLLQLGLNGLWSWLFFGLHRPDLALLDILALWAALTATTLAFFRCVRLAGWLLVPYWLWVSYATGLNGSIWLMNP